MRMLLRHIPEFDEIGFLSGATWSELAELKQGLVFVTGVTGSGKSTTIAGLIDYINKSTEAADYHTGGSDRVCVQQRQSLISQRELGAPLRDLCGRPEGALRENPDIIYLGEIRDPERTVGLDCGGDGPLVVSSLKDVKGSFSRIIDMFPGDRSAEIRDRNFLFLFRM